MREKLSLNICGVQIDQAAVCFSQSSNTRFPGSNPTQQLEADHDAALNQWRLAVERARYEAEHAERQYRAVEPKNRLVARGFETVAILPLQKRNSNGGNNTARAC
jgi:hypothetical protein